MTEKKRLADEFERARVHLRAVAFRLLGSVDDADDAVQEAWLRASGADLAAVANLPGWLTTVVSRICLDSLKARRRQRSAWRPRDEPDAAPSPTLEEQHLFAESVGLAMLVVLERLGPLERVAFVLHDLLSVPFDEIAVVVDRSAVATKKLASRARRRVYGVEPPSERFAAHREVVEAFLAAARAGDVDALVAVLAPDVVRRVDHAARDEGVAVELSGAESVAEETARNAARAAFARPALVDGAVGAVVAPLGRLRFVLKLSVRGGRVASLEVLGDRETLRGVELVVLRA
ncbi:MAG: RNA polymerase subunit sigma-70 [Labilithrix sp.]|nr:RNA polymerase subunit sigma-70 [Labilithrix sp.]